MTTLVELGDRYWALGLPAAAKSAFARAHAAADPHDAVPARRLAELALAVGDTAGARKHAAEVAKREPGPAARVLLGQAQLVAGETAAARMSFAAAIDAVTATRPQKARARLGMAAAAGFDGDAAGASANSMAAFHDLADGLGDQDVELADRIAFCDREISLFEEIAARVAATGQGGEAATYFDAMKARQPDAPVALWSTLLGGARSAHGERMLSDVDLEVSLAAEAAARPTSRVVRLRLVERQLRRRYQDAAAREAAVGELHTLANQLEAEASPESNVELARVWFLLAAAYEDDQSNAAKAEDAYRKGLRLRPGHAEAACRLALLILDRGDTEAALGEIERALRIDAGHGQAWRNAARMLDASSPALADVVERLLDAALPGAGAAAGHVAPRLVTATAEVARGDVLAGVYAHGHRVKNLLGIIGSRTRSARKLAAEGELADKLRDLEREVTALYEEWAQYLRSMQATGPTIEIVPVSPLIHEIVAAAAARASVPVELHVASTLPDLRGDRMLLREALLNIVQNAADAAEKTQGAVTVTARQLSTPSAPAVEVVVADTGPGIPRGELGRIFVPGYTTKETGSGVGLTIAERVIAAHHGRILVDSEEGRGTVMTVVLPTDLGGFASLGALAPMRDPGGL
ncbi:MAG TPA: ATP-binding protein [Kofleriaceae bacterium]|nr:ATP-binding protein [Kofleriaceae bacterium]